MMPNGSPQWDLGRFLNTLSYFGEVPLLGNVRWLQAMLGTDVYPPLPMTDASKPRGLWLLNVPDAIAPVMIEQLGQLGYWVRSGFWPLQASLVGVEAKLADIQAILYWGRGNHPQDLRALADQLQDFWHHYPPIQSQVLFDFQVPTNALEQTWGSVDDVVMGGVSASGITWQADFASFVGYVSTANSGGFASVRTRNFEPALNLADWEGIALRARGDGQRYKFILRDNAGWDSPAYCTSFDTQAQAWQEVHIPFAQMVPTFRAKTLPTAPPLNAAGISSLQLMLSKFEYDRALNPAFTPGNFRLDLAALKVYRSVAALPCVVVGSEEDSLFQAQYQVLSEAGLNLNLVSTQHIQTVGNCQDLHTATTARQLAELCQALLNKSD